MNDSLLFPVNGILNFKNTINEMREETDLWFHWESSENQHHCVGTPIEFKYELLDVMIEYIFDAISSCSSDTDYILKVEVPLLQYFIDRGYKYNVVIPKNSLSYDESLVCPIFHPFTVQQWVSNKKTFAIKWKYMISYINEKDSTQEMNFLTRFLFYGHYGTISKGEKAGVFPPSIGY
jgi:hypothetical protein